MTTVGVVGSASDPPARPWLAHYPPGIPADIDVPLRRLPDLVADIVASEPDRLAFIYYGAKWTYRRFWAEAGAFAATLQRDGLRPGDRLGLYLPNCPMYPIAFFGALRAGVTVVQVSPLYIAQDLVHLLTDSTPSAVVTLEILYPNLAKVAGDVPPIPTYVARLREFYPAWKRPFVNSVLRRRRMPTEFPRGPGVRAWAAAVRGEPIARDATGDPATEVAVLQYTGGTTGRPKAAMLTHRNLVANALQCAAWFKKKTAERHVVLAAVPFFHVYGMTVALNYPLAVGATIVIQTRPDTDESLALMRRYSPTEFPGVPAMYSGINHHPHVDRYNIRSIEVCVSGSAPLPVEVAKRFEALTGGHLIEGYGLTEASPVTHANPVFGERRVGTIGLPFPSTDQRVIDLESGRGPLPPGTPGELCVRGPQVMLGYYRQPEETAGVLVDGWLRTGDIASIDDAGYVTIIDRKKDLINVGGMKVYPREVEEVLFQHPAVLEAAAVGVPDEMHGEVVKAFVVRKPNAELTEADVIQFVRERIAHYKAPRSVEFLDALPRTGVQKVLRRVLRDGAAGPAR